MSKTPQLVLRVSVFFPFSRQKCYLVAGCEGLAHVVTILMCLVNTVSFMLLMNCASHNLSTAAAFELPVPGWEGFGGASPVRTQWSRGSVRCSAVGLYLLHLLQEEASLVMYKHTISSLGVIFFLLCSFSRTVAFVSPRSMTYLFSVSWPPETYQAWVLFHEVAFKSN